MQLYYLSVISYTILGFIFYKLQNKNLNQIRIKDILQDYILSLITLYIIIYSKILFFDLNLLNSIENNFNTFSFIKKFIYIIFIHDFYFYITHRIMHIPKIYKISHYLHHQSKPITPFTALSFHPIEMFIEVGFIPITLLFLKLHYYHFIGYFIFQMIHNLYIHSRLDLFKDVKILNTSIDHWNHHNYNTINYGLYFSFWDRLFKTFN